MMEWHISQTKFSTSFKRKGLNSWTSYDVNVSLQLNKDTAFAPSDPVSGFAFKQRRYTYSSAGREEHTLWLASTVFLLSNDFQIEADCEHEF